MEVATLLRGAEVKEIQEMKRAGLEFDILNWELTHFGCSGIFGHFHGRKRPYRTLRE
jgi:hypothetical protein